VFKLANGSISWVSRKQRTFTHTSAESECIPEASREVTFFLSGMKEATGKESHVIIYDDSQLEQHDRTKYIAVKCHFLWEQIQEDVIVLKYLNTNEMLADVLTNPLPKEKFEFCIQGI
jgi:hypothetical protein